MHGNMNMKKKNTNNLIMTELMPWNRVLFDKLTGSQLVKNFPV